MVKKIQEFEKFKYLFLNQQQLTLFDYIPPPVVKEHAPAKRSSKELEGDEKLSVLKSALKAHDPKNEMAHKYKDHESL